MWSGVLTTRAIKNVSAQASCSQMSCVTYPPILLFKKNLLDSAHRFSLCRMNLKHMPANNHKMITNISNRNTRMHYCQALFSVNCWLAKWSKEVIGEIQFNLQLL